jgi:hypothetical protein
MIQPEERRRQLRRLDDILEALEQLNLHDITWLPEPVATRLREIGIEQPEKHSITELIEKVWAVQQPFLIQLPTERRRRRRRRGELDLRAWRQA